MRNRVGRSVLLSFMTLVLFDASLYAHPVSLTDAVVDIREDSTRFKLSITAEDLVLYYELEANKEFRVSRNLTVSYTHLTLPTKRIV